MKWLPAFVLLASAIGTPAVSGNGAQALPFQSSSARDSAPPQRLNPEILKAWLTAVEQHVPGEIDSPLDQIARWERASVDHAVKHFGVVVTLIRDPKAIITFQQKQGPVKRTVVEYFPRDREFLLGLSTAVGQRVSDSIDERADDEIGDAILRRRQQAADALVRRAAWFHTDLALLGGGEQGRPGRRATAFSTVFLVQWKDGQQTGTHELAGHLDFARTILTYGRRVPTMSSAVALWYRATAADLQHRLYTDRGHLEAAIKQFPQDADLLLHAGALHEMAALPRVQEVVENLSLPSGATLGIESPPSELRQAERLFRRALEANPGLTEARIRQGNVLGLLGRHKDAVKELERGLSEAAGDTLLSFYACMFLGRETEALGDAAGARAFYQKALKLYNRAQSPRVALSALAKTLGNHDEARDTIDLLLSRSWGRDDDPWWRYSQEAGRLAESLLAEARTAFTARRTP